MAKATLGVLVVLASSVETGVALAAPAPRDALAKGQLETARKAYALGKFDAAEKALEEATKTCKKPADCSPALVATIHRDRAVLLAQAKNDLAGAKESFKRALELDPSPAAPPPLPPAPPVPPCPPRPPELGFGHTRSRRARSRLRSLRNRRRPALPRGQR